MSSDHRTKLLDQHGKKKNVLDDFDQMLLLLPCIVCSCLEMLKNELIWKIVRQGSDWRDTEDQDYLDSSQGTNEQYKRSDGGESISLKRGNHTVQHSF